MPTFEEFFNPCTNIRSWCDQSCAPLVKLPTVGLLFIVILPHRHFDKILEVYCALRALSDVLYFTHMEDIK